MELLTFVETATFTKRLAALGLEDSLHGLQLELLANPAAGDVEPGRGARAHYLWLRHKGRIYLLFVYGKNESTALTAEQKRTLRNLAAEIKRTA